MPGRVQQESPTETEEDFTGYEKDEATGLHYAGARYYSAAFGRFTTTDRFADKYPSLSPYQYSANNPVLNVDVNGDSIDVSALRSQKPKLLNKLVTQLSAIAGTNYTVTDEGMLVQMEMPKSEIMGVEVQLQGMKGGSETAQKMLSKAISHKETVSVDQLNKMMKKQAGGGTRGGGSRVWMDPEQLSDLENNATGISPLAQGTGMTFLHELNHTKVLGSLSDAPNSQLRRKLGHRGPVVNKMNTVRSELGMRTRTSYASGQIGGNEYIPFRPQALQNPRRGIKPPIDSTMER